MIVFRFCTVEKYKYRLLRVCMLPFMEMPWLVQAHYGTVRLPALEHLCGL